MTSLIPNDLYNLLLSFINLDYRIQYQYTFKIFHVYTSLHIIISKRCENFEYETHTTYYQINIYRKIIYR